MKKKIKPIFLIVIIMTLLCGCSKKIDKTINENGVNTVTDEAYNKNSVQENNQTVNTDTAETVNNHINEKTYKLFMTSENNYVGDIMPLTDDKGIQLYYLFDTDHNGIGYHPIYKFSTSNLYNYSDDGLAIPYSNSSDDPDIAIGTGSFLLANGVYHCFYTGHNDSYPDKGLDKERIMHAISSDNKKWEKISKDTFQAPEEYSGDDFRDPFVFWNEEEKCYWMLVAARNDNLGGFIAKFTSSDLSKWTLKEPIYAPDKYYMMECPDLFKLGQKYYLFYSWNNVTYYAMSDSMNGPFTEPDNNVLDGQAFYAAKTTEYQGKRYLFGFINRKKDGNDTNNYSWAGNLCVYELGQNPDGTLTAKMPLQYMDYFKNKIDLPKASLIGNAGVAGTTAVIESDGENISGVDFGTLPNTMLLTCKVRIDKKGYGTGFSFGKTNKFENSLGIDLDSKKDLLRYDSCILNRMRFADPSVYSVFHFDEGVTYDVKLVVENDIIVLYMNDTKVLSNRIYKARGNKWGLFSIGGKTTFSDIQIYVP
ncbi:family 43 glycosylhydrolase [Anaerocolumna sp. MB42-C2]|uniref:family 43 glycosylhydrolase n=1 Tax=Anaerocolumna sp. MB42-C2 TaxID=3070997 RepID=UPI0027E03C1C|nr:family 43 glycosylhydrolase [Anaerocolumna sp. MB42-C2]WMJ86798.1 family 43 glycosylhydrolase [Anaerocolumna sp. MB42-C2]